ncbi:MAG: hypothetical protein AAGN35_13220 [Bacteroidota bacterium]
MFGIEILEVGIGLVFMYLVISLICSGIVEAFVKITKLRAKHLKTALGRLLADPNYNGFVKELYEHHLIKSPLEDKIGEPTYIDSRRFATVVFDILTEGGKSDQFEAIEARLATIKDPKVRERLLKILHSSGDQIDSMRDKVEHWFNDSMESVSLWYKKRMRTLVTICGIVVVTAMNADSIQVARVLYSDDDIREATINAARSYSDEMAGRMDPSDSTNTTSFTQNMRALEDDVQASQVLPIGWTLNSMPYERNAQGKIVTTPGEDPILFWLLKIAGILLTTGAVSLGAPYWYAQLKSLLNLRFRASGRQEGGAAAQPITVNVNTNPPRTEKQKDQEKDPNQPDSSGAVG